jgi:hypothetical protein
VGFAGGVAIYPAITAQLSSARDDLQLLHFDV